MNNGLLGWPGSRKAIQQLVATNDVGHRQFWSSSTTWVVPAGVTRIRASALGGGGAGYCGQPSTGGAGGGGGLFLRGWLNVTSGETLTITVGAGGVGNAAGAGTPGGLSQIVQVGRAVIVATGGYAGAYWNAPGFDQIAYYFEGTPLVVSPGKGGGVGGAGYFAGGGGGGGGLSAQNTAGAPFSTAGALGGSGSLGVITQGFIAAPGVAPPLGTPESGGGGAAATARPVLQALKARAAPAAAGV